MWNPVTIVYHHADLQTLDEGGCKKLNVGFLREQNEGTHVEYTPCGKKKRGNVFISIADTSDCIIRLYSSYVDSLPIPMLELMVMKILFRSNLSRVILRTILKTVGTTCAMYILYSLLTGAILMMQPCSRLFSTKLSNRHTHTYTRADTVGWVLCCSSQDSSRIMIRHIHGRCRVGVSNGLHYSRARRASINVGTANMGW